MTRNPIQFQKGLSLTDFFTHFGNVHAIEERCVPRYLAEFEYRFNRRSKMADMIERLAYVSLRSAPKTYASLKLAEMSG